MSAGSRAVPLPSAVESVPVRSTLASLPPSSHRTRPKDGKTRPPGPGLDTRFLGFQSGEGGFELPVPFAQANGFAPGPTPACSC